MATKVMIDPSASVEKPVIAWPMVQPRRGDAAEAHQDAADDVERGVLGVAEALPAEGRVASA
jgi:hypothetical protein